MPNRSTAEVADQIKRLKAVKKRLGRYSGFGDDNHAAIDAQVEFFEKNLDRDAVYDQGWSQHQESSVQDACNWVEGEEEVSPAEGWEEIAN